MIWIRGAAVLAVALAATALSACGRSESYRYKLTLAVETPEGVRSAFNVVEVGYYTVSMPERGVMPRVKGEALYLDLGQGRRPLIALLTTSKPTKNQGGQWPHWIDDQPTALLWRLYDIKRRPERETVDLVAELAAKRGAHELPTNDLPDLVTFGFLDDPKSVMKVDPDNPAGGLGPGIRWRSMTIEVTDEPLTVSIEKHLPWLAAMRATMLDGDPLRHYGAKASFANSLSSANFIREGR